MFLVPPPGLMKPKTPPGPEHIESVSNAVSFLSGNLPLNLSGGPLAGDLLFITSVQGGGTSSAINQPSGFSDLVTLSSDLSGDGNFHFEVMYKIATGSEGTNFGLTRGPTGVAWCAGISCFRNNSLANPTLDGFRFASGTSPSHSFPEVEATLDSSDLSCLFIIANRSGVAAADIASRPVGYSTAFEQGFSNSGPGGLGSTDRILMSYFAQGSSLAPRPLTSTITFNNGLEAHSAAAEVENL